MLRSSKKRIQKSNDIEINDVIPVSKRIVPYRLSLPTRPRVVGIVLVCGQGDFGQLGLGEEQSQLECPHLKPLEGIENAVDVCAGGMHSLILTNEGLLYSFGCNDEGALGRDTTSNSEYRPYPIELPGAVLKVTAGDSHSACLLEDGRVFAWGAFRNQNGSMGLTNNPQANNRLPIELIPGLTCSDIASGEDHLVILTLSGRVLTLGCGDQGQLGRISLRSVCGDSRRGVTDLLNPREVQMIHTKRATNIWATSRCTFVRESGVDGKILGFGLNNFSQLINNNKRTDSIATPIDTHLTNVKHIAGGIDHTLILQKDGECLTIGRYDYGRLGLGELKTDLNTLRIVPQFDRKIVTHISCGGAQSFAITEDGKLYVWGMGTCHQLGTGSTGDVLVPTLVESTLTKEKRFLRVSCGGQHTLFLLEGKMKKSREKINVSQARSKKNTHISVHSKSDNNSAREINNPIDDSTIEKGFSEMSQELNSYNEDKLLRKRSRESPRDLDNSEILNRNKKFKNISVSRNNSFGEELLNDDKTIELQMQSSSNDKEKLVRKRSLRSPREEDSIEVINSSKKFKTSAENEDEKIKIKENESNNESPPETTDNSSQRRITRSMLKKSKLNKM